MQKINNAKNRFFRLGIVFVAFLFLCGSASALEISNIRFGQHGSSTRIVMDMDNEADFRAMTQDTPPRIVIDMPMVSQKPAIKRSNLPNLIGDIKLEPLASAHSRLTIILEQKAVIRSAFVMPASGNQSARLVIDTSAADDTLFQKYLGKAYGTLTLSAAAAGASTKLPFAGIGGTKLDPIAKPKPPEERPLIMIDAGHGGFDPGASQSGIKEKDVTLAVAMDLKRSLLATGKFRVEMTRNKDVFIRLQERVRIARRAGADMFISIHADSAPDAGTAAKGASFYTISETASDTIAASLAARENKVDMLAGVDLPSEDKEVADILIDLTMRETVNQSRYIADTLVRNFRKNGLPLLEGPHKHAGFMVLKAPDIPSVLVELGFLSNPAEAKKLNDKKYRETLANAIAEGIETWFKTSKH
ncbi:MAG: N-acetylmuramoyl-L-alanine amidase [Proteobacteria bacterium]|nr:N-acetylmuramoyl-L-alanine amidase [Pseudomonadota bacterium]